MGNRSRTWLISGWLWVNFVIPAHATPAYAAPESAATPSGSSPVPKAVPAQAPAVVDVAPKATESSNSLVGQCRAANKRTPLYSSRNPVSEVVMLLETNATVTLSENGGENGMVGVSKPKVGFVHAPNLKNCANASTPKPAITGVCRLVVQPQGLLVRSEAGNNAPVVGSVAPKSKITLVDPISTVERDDGRIWLKVAQPVAGWVSNGFVSQQFRNLGACE